MAVLNKKTSGIPEGAVYIGRGSRWGNPFVMRSEADRDQVCDDYEALLKQRIDEGRMTLSELSLLHGRDLVCFCAPKRCHGHTLEAYAKAAHEQLNQEAAPMKEFRLIVAGGRDFDDYTRLHSRVFAIAEEAGDNAAVSLVSGMARGADALGVRLAKEENVMLHEFPADWNQYGKSAGHRRNAEMAAFADGLLAYWDGSSRGTKNMIETMQKLGKPVIVEYY